MDQSLTTDIIEISFDLESNQVHCPFVFDVLINGVTVQTINGFDRARRCSVEVSDSGQSSHVLEIRMQGKTSDHTKLNSDGTIAQDILISIQEVCLDGVNLGHAFLEHTVYSHDFNGTQHPVTVPFSGHMGCNGTVRFEFFTPVYLWLLENL